MLYHQSVVSNLNVDITESVSDKKPGMLQNKSSLIDDDDQARADTYSILASLLSGTPGQDLIDYLSHINAGDQQGDKQRPGDIALAWLEIKDAASTYDLNQLDDEYHELFIGLGRGQVIPYGSWHMTGFLMDKPLSDLRDDLARLGIAASQDTKDPEDHIAALCETMSILITAYDVEGYQQRRFYIRHIHPWADKFFKSLQTASSAKFYRSVGLLGQRFVELENQYLNISEH